MYVRMQEPIEGPPEPSLADLWSLITSWIEFIKVPLEKFAAKHDFNLQNENVSGKRRRRQSRVIHSKKYL
jgi:hypothetical protein